ncbi:MAG: NAD(P)-binding protein [Chloroflexota bacterium]
MVPENRRKIGHHARRKVAVLGGGISALSTVLAMTDEPNWQKKHDITVYQMGWRLGGKGASGRNLDIADRIEEHGLHIWFGFYENAFRVMRQCYEELGRDPSQPMATWQDAFKPHNLVVLQEQINGRWQQWAMELPTKPGLPGDGNPKVSPGEWIRGLMQVARQMIKMLFSKGFLSNHGDASIIKNLALASSSSIMMLLNLTDKASSDTVDRLGNALSVMNGSTATAVSDARKAIWDIVHDWIEQSDEMRRLWIVLDLTLTILYGTLKDKVMEHGFQSIDHYDFTEWLALHGAAPMTVRSAPIRALYDLAFAFEDGDINQPNFAAGVTLHAIYELVFSYKGAFMWKMQAGMGDIVFTPIYQVLKQRGVKFKFFHRVENLGLSDDGQSIATLRIARQATLKDDDYNPLVDVKGLDCWPDRPLYEQLIEGEQMQAKNANLECSWNPWQPVETLHLKKGEDFDDIVLGISIGALPYICNELIEARKSWRRMVENVKTVQTLAFQTWLKPSAPEMGWEAPTKSQEGPVQSAYVEPIDTWADLSYLVEAENWPEEQQPGHIGYFCGPLNEPEPIQPFSDHGFPQREKARIREMMQGFFENDVAHLWPDAVNSETGELKWDLLIDGQNRQGSNRLDAQYYRANVEPTERYVHTPKGSTRYRLKPDESGFDNLYLAGDWTDNSMNSGCIEASVMSGLLCAAAITKREILIQGVPDSYYQPSRMPYHVLTDCPNCGVQNGVIKWVDPGFPFEGTDDTTCQFCGRMERGGVLKNEGQMFADKAAVTAVLQSWATRANTKNVELFTRANFRGLSINEVAYSIRHHRSVPTSFHTHSWLIGKESEAKDCSESLVAAQALTAFALADGTFDEQEYVFIQNYLRKNGYQALATIDLRPWLPQDIAQPQNPEDLLHAMLELGWSNGWLKRREWQLIKQFAIAWNFSLPKLARINKWFEKRQASLMNRFWVRWRNNDPVYTIDTPLAVAV